MHEATISGAKGTSSKSDHVADELLPVAQQSSGNGGASCNGGEGKCLSAKDLMGSQVQAASDAAFERGHSSAAMAGRWVSRARSGEWRLYHGNRSEELRFVHVLDRYRRASGDNTQGMQPGGSGCATAQMAGGGETRGRHFMCRSLCAWLSPQLCSPHRCFPVAANALLATLQGGRCPSKCTDYGTR